MGQQAEPGPWPSMLRNKSRQTSLVSVWVIEDDAGVTKIDPTRLVDREVTIVSLDQTNPAAVYQPLDLEHLQIRRGLVIESRIPLDAEDGPVRIEPCQDSRDPAVPSSGVH